MYTSNTARRVAARRAMGYGELQLVRGQIFELVGGINDEKLVRLHYVVEIAPAATGELCPECGVEFVSPPERDAHLRAAHPARATG